MKTTLGTESAKDKQLVEWSLTGDREAFGQIVERYKSLVCSITYGATGSLTLSEDIAQETFLTAWRQLTALKDATRLRAWLCGIARNLVNNSLRRGQREPVQAAACAVVGFDSGDSSFKMIMKPTPKTEIRTTGASHYRGDMWIDLKTKWVQQVALTELVVSETTLPGPPNKVSSVIELTMLIQSLGPTEFERAVK